MKKYLIIAAAAAAVLAAGCAKNEVIQTQGPGDAVSFGVYTYSTKTVGGEVGTQTNSYSGEFLQIRFRRFLLLLQQFIERKHFRLHRYPCFELYS